MCARDVVSSPHRYCRNGEFDLYIYVRIYVSSPHRYCRNEELEFLEALGAEFQALIGTVETLLPSSFLLALPGFKPS